MGKFTLRLVVGLWRTEGTDPGQVPGSSVTLADRPLFHDRCNRFHAVFTPIRNSTYLLTVRTTSEVAVPTLATVVAAAGVPCRDRTRGRPGTERRAGIEAPQQHQVGHSCRIRSGGNGPETRRRAIAPRNTRELPEKAPRLRSRSAKPEASTTPFGYRRSPFIVNTWSGLCETAVHLPGGLGVRGPLPPGC